MSQPSSSHPAVDVPRLPHALPPPLPPTEIEPDLLDLDSLKVIARLRRHGHQAYLVGGCVRDLLVGVRPKDYDVVTSAHPDTVRDIFRNSRLIGRRFRLAHVYFPGGRFVEVATFRANPIPDAEGGDGDLLVTDDNLFGTAEEDARRRDFTINGLFYDVTEGQVIDFVGGREDLDHKRVRTIGDPEIRMREDPVRGLRAARIAAKLGFQIEPATFAAMRRYADELPRCAPARVLEETLKLLRTGASMPAFRILRDAGLLRVLIPPVHEVIEHGGERAAEALFTRLAALDTMIRDGKPVSDAVMLATLLSFLPLHAVPEPDDDEADEEEPDSLEVVLPNADKVLAQMSQHARLPRRVADRVRAIIGSQRLFLAPVRKKRRRRGSGGFVRTPHFAEALQLFEIGVRATGEHADVLARWQSRVVPIPGQGLGEQINLKAFHAPPVENGADDGPPVAEPPADETQAAANGADPERKKRRRRGGRRHRKGAPADGEPTDSAPSNDASDE